MIIPLLTWRSRRTHLALRMLAFSVIAIHAATAQASPPSQKNSSVKPPSVAAAKTQEPYRYWPRFPRPKQLFYLPAPDGDDAATLATLSGLVARAEQAGQTDALIWIPTGHPAYELWLKAMTKQTGAQVVSNVPLWDLVDKFAKQGVVKGYVLYHPEVSEREMFTRGDLADPSINVATSLCAPFGGIVVSEAQEKAAQQHGLTRLFDARGMTDQQCFDQFHDKFNRRLVALCDPKTWVYREQMVAEDAFVVTGAGPTYNQALAWADQDARVIGWGIGQEDGLTLPSTKQGVFQTVSNWADNWPAMSTESAGVSYPQSALRPKHVSTLWDLPWEDNVHYTAFIMSDGDNLCWAMSNFLMGENSWYGSPARGKVPIGWTFPSDGLAQVCPYAATYVYNNATPNDDFVLMGGGYYYPDYYGVDRPESNALALHAQRIAQYVRLNNVRTMLFNFQTDSTPMALDAYSTIAKAMPGLNGVFVITYGSYSSPDGPIRWVSNGKGDQMPIVRMQYAIWNHVSRRNQEGDPKHVAELLNSATYAGKPTSNAYYSAVIVHCWSYFNPPGTGPDEEVDQTLGGKGENQRGYMPVVWCTQQLERHVRVVTPNQLTLLMRLRMQSKSTLTQALSTLHAQWRTAASTGKVSQGNLAKSKHWLSLADKALTQADYKSAFLDGKAARDAIASKVQ